MPQGLVRQVSWSVSRLLVTLSCSSKYWVFYSIYSIELSVSYRVQFVSLLYRMKDNYDTPGDTPDDTPGLTYVSSWLYVFFSRHHRAETTRQTLQQRQQEEEEEEEEKKRCTFDRRYATCYTHVATP